MSRKKYLVGAERARVREQVAKLYADGATRAQVLDRVRWSGGALGLDQLERLLREAGVRHKPTPERVAKLSPEIVRLYSTGMSLDAVREHLADQGVRVSYGFVRNVVARAGVLRRRTGWRQG